MLRNKTIVIAGACGLLGRSFVEAVVGEGGRVIVTALDEIGVRDLEKKLRTRYPADRLDSSPLDITSEKSLTDLIHFLDEKYGRIDGFVNSAYPKNSAYGKSFFDISYNDFCEHLNLHLGGYFLASQTFLKYFMTQNYGTLVNISSIYGVIAPKFEIYEKTAITVPIEYAASKSALIHLTKYMAKIAKGKNIRVNCISPGGINDHQPQSFMSNYRDNCLNKGMLDPKDIIGTLIFLLSEMSQYISGQNFVVDDGFTL